MHIIVDIKVIGNSVFGVLIQLTDRLNLKNDGKQII